MKAVILAAGLGSRIHSVTGGQPKCLLQFGGRSILDYQIESLLDGGVSQIALVLGHARRQIISHVARMPATMRKRIDVIGNPQYASTNNIYSLWLARPWVDGDSFVCLNADVLFHPEIIAPALRPASEVSVIIDREFREETMKVILDGARVTVMQKGIPRDQFDGTYIGITTFSSCINSAFFREVEALVAAGRTNVFFNVAVERLIAAGTHVGFTETGGLPWAEVDDPADLAFARRAVFPRLVASLPSAPLTAA